MNTYIQDTTIPIYIILQYDYYTLKFPVNPESIKKEISSGSTTEEIEGIGQISIPKTPDLAKITIESFFWQYNNVIPSSLYVMWIERWQKSKKPAYLIITRLNYSMEVTCESFSHWINAGEEEDIYFSLQLQEYRPHGAKKIKGINDKNLLQKAKELKDEVADKTFVLIDLPRNTRSSLNKKSYTNPYTVLQNETILTITKKITGSSKNWKSLYDENKDVLGNIFDNESQIPSGTKLKLPDDWVNNQSYNIVQEIT